MRTKFGVLCLAVLAIASLAGCGGTEAPEAVSMSTAKADEGSSGTTCGLLTREQVDAVLPGNDGGNEQSTPEASLLTDVEMGHCRYLAIDGSNVKWLDLLVYRASSDEGFEQIKIGEWAHQGSSRRLEFGDVGFLLDMSDQDEIEATVSTGRTVVELKLDADDAAARSEQLVELARIVTQQF